PGTEAGVPDRFPPLKGAGVIDLVDFADHAMPFAFGVHRDLERTAFPVPFERLDAHLPRSTPMPLADAKPIELRAEFPLIEHGREARGGRPPVRRSGPAARPAPAAAASTGRTAVARRRGLSRQSPEA